MFGDRFLQHLAGNSFPFTIIAAALIGVFAVLEEQEVSEDMAQSEDEEDAELNAALKDFI